MGRERAEFIPPAPPKTPKAAATRGRILEVAAALFLERGYSAVSIQDIAEQAQLTKGGVYGHFRSKGQLLVEVIRWMHTEREHSEYFGKALQDPYTAVGELFDEAGRPTRLLMVDAAAAARHDRDVAAGMVRFDQERQAAIRARLAGAVSDPRTVAWLMSALSMGTGMREAMALRPPALKRLYAVLRLLTAGVRR